MTGLGLGLTPARAGVCVICRRCPRQLRRHLDFRPTGALLLSRVARQPARLPATHPSPRRAGVWHRAAGRALEQRRLEQQPCACVLLWGGAVFSPMSPLRCAVCRRVARVDASSPPLHLALPPNPPARAQNHCIRRLPGSDDKPPPGKEDDVVSASRARAAHAMTTYQRTR